MLVCGVAELLELEFEPEVELDADDELEELELDVVPLLFDEAVLPDVAAVTCFVVVALVSLHAIAPPKESAAATLSAAAARRARWARGFLRSPAIGGSFESSLDLDRPYGSRVRLR